ncbi:MAG TPA: hypothetical protein PKV80_04005, partial [Leptospiraceae bacterium]|nr:hypothetical protein [Leptospiraceae bacterium]
QPLKEPQICKVTEGKYEIQFEFKFGRKVSRSYKTVSLEGKPGEVYMICSITNAERELFRK